MGSIALRKLDTIATKNSLSDVREERKDRGTAVASQPTKDEYQITEITEIKLDGRTCKYRDVPKNAEITSMEVTADKKIILKIHFQSRGGRR